MYDIGRLSATEMKQSGMECGTDWHAVRAYRIREILYGKYRKGIP